MDIKAEKLQLISELVLVTDEALIAKVKNLLKKTKEEKNYLPIEEEEYILKKLDASDKSVKAGKTRAHAEVMGHFRQKIKDLKK